MFIHEARIFLHHTDATGRLFFANQFYLLHEAKDLLLESLGLPISAIIEDPGISFPLVHAEADYKTALVTGDPITIHVWVERVGETSVTFSFRIFKGPLLAGTARTVNVVVNKATGKKMSVPDDWRKKLAVGVLEE